MKLRFAEMALKNKGWRMAKLAEELDVDHQTVMYWNQGRTYPRFKKLIALCRVLECTLEDLVGPINA